MLKPCTHINILVNAFNHQVIFIARNIVGVSLKEERSPQSQVLWYFNYMLCNYINT